MDQRKVLSESDIYFKFDKSLPDMSSEYVDSNEDPDYKKKNGIDLDKRR